MASWNRNPSSNDGVPGMVPTARAPTQEASDEGAGELGRRHFSTSHSSRNGADDAWKVRQPIVDDDDFHYPLSLNELDPPLYLAEGGDDRLGYAVGELGGEFDLYGELFHIFISYRVVTEGSERPGNRLARRLYDELHVLSRDVAMGLSIPPEGCGVYPVRPKSAMSCIFPI
jgi:hypothetical protein